MQEENRCSFCKRIKTVSRKYISAGNKNLNDEKQDTFVIIYYCDDCGIEK